MGDALVDVIVDDDDFEVPLSDFLPGSDPRELAKHAAVLEPDFLDLARCGLLTWSLLTPRTRLATSRSHAFAGRLAGLLHPVGELIFVELVVLVDVEVAHVLVPGLAGRERTQRRAAEERHFDVLREAMKAEEPDLVLDAIEGRVPLHGLAHAGDGATQQR
jgi:hypothetical protein